MNCSRSLDNIYEHLRIIKMKMKIRKGNKSEMVVVLDVLSELLQKRRCSHLGKSIVLFMCKNNHSLYKCYDCEIYIFIPI